MLQLISNDGKRLLETDYRKSRILVLRTALLRKPPTMRKLMDGRLTTDVVGRVSGLLNRIAARGPAVMICTANLAEGMKSLKPSGEREQFPFLIWGDFVVSFPTRKPSERNCAECELQILKEGLSGFRKAIAETYSLSNTPEQLAFGLEYVDALLFQRMSNRSHVLKSELLIVDTRTGGTLVRSVPLFRCPAHLVNLSTCHEGLLFPKVSSNHYVLPGFVISDATVSNSHDLGEGGAVDVSAERAEVRARFEAMERFIFRVLARAGPSVAAMMERETIDWSRWVDIFERVETSGHTVCVVRRNVGYAAHTQRSLARVSALFEMLERNIVPISFSEQRILRLDVSMVSEELGARLGRAGLEIRLFLCINEFTPTILSFVCDNRGNGASGTASAPAIRMAAEAAVLNALGMYVFRSNSAKLLNVSNAWCWDLKVADPGLENLSVRMDLVLDRFRPQFLDVPAALTQGFSEKVSVSACMSEHAGYSYHHGAVPDEFWEQLSLNGCALLREQGQLISLV